MNTKHWLLNLILSSFITAFIITYIYPMIGDESIINLTLILIITGIATYLVSYILIGKTSHKS